MKSNTAMHHLGESCVIEQRSAIFDADTLAYWAWFPPMNGQ